MGSQIFGFWGEVGIQNGKILVKKIREFLFIKFNYKLALTALHPATWDHINKVDA